MKFKDFLRICNTIHERKIVKDEIFYGLIGKKAVEKKKFYYEGLKKEEALDKIIDFELREKDEEFLSLKAIIKIIKKIDYDDLVSETTMNDRFLIFIEKIGSKEDYTLSSEKHFKFVKAQILIVIFILIELGTSQALLNMYTTQAKDRITYIDLEMFFHQLYNFLEIYIEDPEMRDQVFNSFSSHFKFDMLMSYKNNLGRFSEIYELIDGYEKLETAELNVRIALVDQFDKTLNKVFYNIENAFKEGLNNNIEETNKNSKNIKFKFLESIGY
ncbi:hypothetical protein PM10SUCC1_19310 [Propionigenium maris DSM 9537]|uniref:Uncharacterized protein n=1 Tax=Propionigenium maris DSM 9537 TaxID=1123000 RepID=A0A9W6LNA0_9FUSO|nr:hypothetical protein [Propionigenium maris]GLI56417.1 hypothetical protein PM10SUCC1_19310 [Propionigenium maris DSM 9537]